MMKKVSATEFAKNFGRYRDSAQREPVAVTSHGRTAGYFVSAQEYLDLKAGKRRVWRVADLPKELAEAIRDSRMDPKYDHLNALLEDE